MVGTQSPVSGVPLVILQSANVIETRFLMSYQCHTQPLTCGYPTKTGSWARYGLTGFHGLAPNAPLPAGAARAAGARNAAPPYCLATLAAIWSTMLNTAAWAGLTANTVTSMATLLLTANAR